MSFAQTTAITEAATTVITTGWDGSVLTHDSQQYASVGDFATHAEEELTMTLSTGERWVHPLGADVSKKLVLYKTTNVISDSAQDLDVELNLYRDPAPVIRDHQGYRYTYLGEGGRFTIQGKGGNGEVLVNLRYNRGILVNIRESYSVPFTGGFVYEEPRHKAFEELFGMELNLDQADFDADAMVALFLRRSGTLSSTLITSTNSDIPSQLVFERGNEGIAGRSTNSCADGYNIGISTRYWDGLSTTRRVRLLWHELGHALMERAHVDCSVNIDTPAQEIMWSHVANTCSDQNVAGYPQNAADFAAAEARFFASTDGTSLLPYADCGPSSTSGRSLLPAAPKHIYD